MKYKTFRNIVLAGVVAGIGGIGWWATREEPYVPSGPPPVIPQVPSLEDAARNPEGAAPADAGAPKSDDAPAGGIALSGLEQRILELAAQPTSMQKIKDAIPGGPKVNFYHDNGKGYYNRVKIDIDRDEKWDEKWELEGGKLVQRQVSSADNDAYDLTYVQNGNFWMAPGASSGSAASNAGDAPVTSGTSPAVVAPSIAGNIPSPAGASVGGDGVNLRPIDQSILTLIAAPAHTDKVKDAVRGPIKVNLYHDDGSGYFNRLKIDLDRDEKWDEKWDLAQGKVVKREVATADDQQYNEEYRLEGSMWKKGTR